MNFGSLVLELAVLELISRHSEAISRPLKSLLFCRFDTPEEGPMRACIGIDEETWNCYTSYIDG
jgi:hypothetical protein